MKVTNTAVRGPEKCFHYSKPESKHESLSLVISFSLILIVAKRTEQQSISPSASMFAYTKTCLMCI